jgi:hypothetical protein
VAAHAGHITSHGSRIASFVGSPRHLRRRQAYLVRLEDYLPHAQSGADKDVVLLQATGKMPAAENRTWTAGTAEGYEQLQEHKARAGATMLLRSTLG